MGGDPMASARKKRPLERTEGTLRDARLVVIASEGSHTEEIYFRAFRETRVRIRVIPSSDGKSSPRHVFDNLRAYASEYEIGAGDELWAVVDRDRWPTRALSEIAALCRDAGFRLAVSNPCFELWLALHFGGLAQRNPTHDDLRKMIVAGCGSFSKASYDAEAFVTNVGDAIQRALALDTRPQNRWPQSTGTRVYLLARSILGLDR